MSGPVRLEGRKKEIFEVAVFLLLVVPSMITSYLARGKEWIGFPVLAVSVILRDIALTCLVVFFLWRDGESLERLGWKSIRFKEEVAWGVALFLPILFGETLLTKAFEWFGLTPNGPRLPQFLTARGPAEIVLASVLAAVVAVAEETLFRGYLILRLENLTGSLGVAVLVSSAVFCLGHGYEGAASVGTIAVLGVILALIYIWRKSLVAPVVLHFLIDFFPLVLLPLYGIR